MPSKSPGAPTNEEPPHPWAEIKELINAAIRCWELELPRIHEEEANNNLRQQIQDAHRVLNHVDRQLQ